MLDEDLRPAPDLRSPLSQYLSRAELRTGTLACMGALDFDCAETFIAAIPPGRWAAYKDVAAAAGSPRGGQALGQWLRVHGHGVPLDYRVLTVSGTVSDGFRPAGPDAPASPALVRDRLMSEGVVIDARGRASEQQRFTAADWTG